MVTIVSILNNTDGTYDITFSELVTVGGGMPVTELNLLMFSASSFGWFSVRTDIQVNPTTVRVIQNDSDGDCTFCVMLAQPINLTALHAFETAAPVIAIP
jgi:hypothetical protein